MALHKIFFTDGHRLRFVWSTMIFSGFVALGFLALSQLPSLHHLAREITAVWALLVSFYVIHRIERRPVGMLGLSWNAFSARQTWAGLMLGAAMVTAVIATCIAMNDVEMSGDRRSTLEIINILAPQFIAWLAVAMLEELLFRGYPFQLAIERSSPAVAIAIFSLVFGIAHWNNRDATVLSTINTVLAGVWLSAAYVRTRQLWLPIALHLSWNFTLGTVWGAAVSGYRPETHLLRTDLLGPAWLTGGAYGVEGGFLCSVILIIGTGAIYALPACRMSPEQFALMHRVRYAEDRAVLTETDHA